MVLKIWAFCEFAPSQTGANKILLLTAVTKFRPKCYKITVIIVALNIFKLLSGLSAIFFMF